MKAVIQDFQDREMNKLQSLQEATVKTTLCKRRKVRQR